MKLVILFADAARLDVIRRELHDLKAPGYSVLPVVEGEGRTGLHSGDRIHPGALAAIFVVAPDEQATTLFEDLARRRDAAGDTITRLFMLPVERQA
jgi:hypothetical protein